MQATLLDEDGNTLTEITYRPGVSPGRLVVDMASDPDALFKHYFAARGGRAVTLVEGSTRTPAALGTLWLNRTRTWYVRPLPSRTPDVRSAQPRIQPQAPAVGL